MHLRPTAFRKRSEPINDTGSSFGVDRAWSHGFINRLLSFLPIFFSCALTTIIITAPVAAHAVQFEGVQIPDTLEVDGKTLHLNGYGLRKYSILGIHVYVASLYLERLSTNPEKIIQSSETKLLNVRFERNVNANAARKAWRIGLANNCKAPCHLDPNDVERFLAGVPAMHNGDNYSLLFTQDGATVTVSGRQIGTISQPQFAEAMLAIFLGPKPASPSLKQELLRGHG